MKILNKILDAKWLVLISLIIGMGLGLLWGWVIQPVEWTDADPTLLAQNYQEDYLRMAIDSFRVNAQEDLARGRVASLGPNGEALFAQIKTNPGTIDKNFLLLFENVILGKQNPQAEPSASTSGEATKQPDNSQSSSVESDNSWLVSVEIGRVHV